MRLVGSQTQGVQKVRHNHLYSKNNLILSLAIKEQLRISNRLFSKSAINWNEITYGPEFNKQRKNTSCNLSANKDSCVF
jgi:hypothetical protein